MRKLTRRAVMGIAIIIALSVGALTMRSERTLQELAVSRQATTLLHVILASAIIDSINPCAFSVLFITIAFLVSLGKLRSDILIVGSSYIAGIFTTYLLIGLGITEALSLFNTPHGLAKITAIILMGFGGISLIGAAFPAFPIKFQIPQFLHGVIGFLIERGSIPAAFLVGTIVGATEFPCTGGPYLVVLSLLHDRSTLVEGMSYLLLYNVVFVAPLAVILLVASDTRVLESVQSWRQRHKGKMKLVSGVAMILLGIIVFLTSL